MCCFLTKFDVHFYKKIKLKNEIKLLAFLFSSKPIGF